MTIFSTASQGWDTILHVGVPLLLACAAVLALACWIVKGAWARRSMPRYGRVAAAVLVALAGTPLYAWTAFVILIGIAAFDCPPDAYECPL
jgi:hypothetical protein